MKTNSSTKTTNTLSVSHENTKNTRKTLKVLQQTADNKENLAGRSRIIKDTKLDSELDVKTKQIIHKSTQTGEPVVTADDLTSKEEPGKDYWKMLAETRNEALNNSLQENERLKDHIESLTNENETYKGMIEESRHLVDVLKEMIGYEESDTSTDDAEEGRERA